MPLPPDLLDRARAALEACRRAGARACTAESCTGGLVAAALTAIPGSSDVVDRGFVTYSNDAKEELLGVPAELLAAHGAVSEPVARAMAEGALRRSRAQVAVAITGIAGPGGGTPDKPVGLVYLALAVAGRPTTAERLQLPGDRDAVREATARRALELLAAAF
ncbi:MAG TPA: nicotinamide-nucleotide amidohydrolase family protein [Myxococcales bacterium]|nr:nicotinamide-nucleotide amidohydrolase family protein [Myxococcales bacterium]